MGKKQKLNQGVKIIKKSNQLIEARYKFNVWESRIFLSVLAQIRKEDMDFQTYRIRYGDVIKVFALKSNQSYALLREGAKSLMQKKFFISSFEGGFERETAYHIIRSVNYLKEGQTGAQVEQQEYIDITVEPEMKPLLLQLQQNFTAYDLQNVAKLGPQSLRLYELLKQYERIGERTLEIDYIRRILEMEKEYPLFADFYKWFVRPAVRDINSFTDLSVSEPDKIKEGKKVVALRFKITRKQAYETTRFSSSESPVKRAENSNKSVLKKNNDSFVASQDILAENPAIEVFSPVLESYFEKLNEWWGIEREPFAKRVGDKTEADIETAIAFTKSRIKLGKADNPAGVFLEALTKGHKTLEQAQAQKKAEKERFEREQRSLLQPIVKQYEDITDTYAKAINDTIQSITSADPSVTEKVISQLKIQLRNLGDKRADDKTIDDFRKNPLLRNMVKREIMMLYPDRFQVLAQSYEPAIENLRNSILGIKPDFKFE